jgi:myosin heavy chain 9/10/11/14
MPTSAHNMGSIRNNPFARAASSSPGPNATARPKTALFGSPPPVSTGSTPTPPTHTRHQSHTAFGPVLAPTSGSHRHSRSDSRSATPMSSTFAPSFIKTEEMRRGSDTVKGIEGENDFSGKRYVWLKDPQAAFVKGWVVEELPGNRILVQCDDGSVC